MNSKEMVQLKYLHGRFLIHWRDSLVVSVLDHGHLDRAPSI